MNLEQIFMDYPEMENQDISEMSQWFMGVGIAAIVIGTLAVILPYVATLAVNMLMGIILLIGGAMYLVHSLQIRKWRNAMGEMLLSAFFFLIGFFFLAYPFSGIMVLTVSIAVFFLIHGISRMLIFLSLRSWFRIDKWVAVSSVISILLGIVILSGLPGIATWVIGLMLGIDLIVTGITLSTLGYRLKDHSENNAT